MTARNPGRYDAEIALLHAEVAALQAELAETRETLQAIQHGEVDALIVETPTGPRAFSLETLDQPYREIVENINEGAATIAPDGAILYANDRFIAMTGVDEGLVVGGAFTEFLAAQCRERFATFLGDSLNAPRREEFDLVAADGSFLPVQISSHLLPRKETTTICVILTDIAERIRAEKELGVSLEETRRKARENAALLGGAQSILTENEFAAAGRTIADACMEILGGRFGFVALLDGDGTQIVVPCAAVGESSGEPGPELPPSARALSEEVSRTGKVAYDNIPKSGWTESVTGDRIVLDNLLFAPLNVGGVAVGVLGIADKPDGFTDEDATVAQAFGDLAAIALRESRARSEMAESEDRFHQLFDNMASGVAIYEPVDDGEDLMIVDINKAGQALSQVSRAAVVGRRVTDVFPSIREMGLLEVFQRVARTGATEHHPLTRYRDGRLEQWVENHVFRLPTGLVVALYDDTSEMHRAERALQKSEKQLASAVEIAGLAPWEYDVDTDLFTFNDHFYSVFRTTAEREGGYSMVPDEYLRRFVHPDDIPRVAASIRQSLENPKRHPQGLAEHRVLFGDGTTGHITVRSYMVMDEEGRTVRTYGVNQDITERKTAEAKVRASEEALVAAQRISQIGSWSYDVATDRPTWSREMFRLFRREEEKGEPSWQEHRPYVHPEDWDMLNDTVMAAIHQSRPFDMEYRIAPQGEPIWMRVIGTVVQDDTGKVIELRGTVQDITNRKLAEDALRASEEQYRTLAENIGIGVAMISPEMKILTLNRQMREWFPEIDVSTRPVCYRAFNDPPGEFPCSYCPTMKTLQDGQTHEGTTRTPTTEGIKHFRIVSTPVRDKGGKVRAAIEMVEDVTVRKRTESLFDLRYLLLEFSRSHTLEEALREILDRTEEMTDSRFGFYHFIDPDLELVTLQAWSSRTENEFCEDVESGHTCPIDEDETWMDVVRRKQAVVHNDPGLLPQKRALPEGHGRIVRELVVPVERGNRIVAVLSVGNKSSDYRGDDAESTSYLADIAWEICERKLAEAEHSNTEDQLRQAQKMESIGRLAGGVAHDFNNLLTVILNYTSLLRTSFDANDPILDDIEEIHQAGQRAAELTSQLLAFSRKQITAPRVIDLNAVMRRSEKMLQRLIGEDIDLTFSLDEDLEEIDVDPGQMDQILVNLAVNARDAMLDGGRLLVETTNVVLDDLYVRVHPYAQAGHYVMLAVSDTGSGMDRETQQQIFEPFFTTKTPDKGTGLGLSTVYGIVKQSRGSIEVYSEAGTGTTFKVYLPIAARDAVEEIPARSDVASRGRETVLLIEDEASVRKIAKKILESRGYTVLESAHPGEALVIARQQGESIDMVLTDVVMPDMSGKECYRQICEIVPEVKVLFMSGYTADAMANRGVLEEGIHFIQKPFTVESLVQRVRAVLDGLPPI